MKTILTVLIGCLFLVACGVDVEQPIDITPQETAEQTQTVEQIRIGYMGPLSGPAATYGQSVQRAIQMAHDELDLNNVRLIFEDSRCEGGQAAQVVNKLVNVDRVHAIIGELCSGATMAAVPVAQNNGVVMVSPASTSPELSDVGDYFFRTVPSDAIQGVVGAQLVWDMGYENLAILYGNEDYGVAFNQVLTQSFQELGGTVVRSEPVNPGVVDVRSQLTQINNANPDAVFMIFNNPETALSALRQMDELGMTDIVSFGSEGLHAPDFVTPENRQYTQGLIVTSVSEGTESFRQQHMDVYGEAPGPFAAQAYDAYMILAQAIQDGAMTSEQIRDALAGMEYQGVSGLIAFDEHGDIEGTFVAMMVEDDQFVMLE